tara:strand:+ start:506 stop:727 length:222 start_codon:yes stop_codon:yes gene_type:complete
MEIEKIYDNIKNQQLYVLQSTRDVIYTSGNMMGIPQWIDRNKLHKLIKTVEDGRLLTKKDFQFLESLVLKYKF